MEKHRAVLKLIKMYFPIVILLMFSNCAMYYFSAKTLEPGKCDIGLGVEGGYVAHYEYGSGFSGLFKDGDLYDSPPIYIYTKVGLPKGFNLSVSLGSSWYIPIGLTAGVSKRIYNNELKRTEVALEAGGIVLLSGMSSYVRGGYISCNNYTKFWNIGFSFKTILESQSIREGNMFDNDHRLSDKKIFF